MDEALTALHEAILTLLDQREPGKSICPSEAARLAFPENWRSYMERTRDAAIQLAETNAIEICQGGNPVENFQFKGPIRLRKPS